MSELPIGWRHVKVWGPVGPLAVAAAVVLSACGAGKVAASSHPATPAAAPAAPEVVLTNVAGFGPVLTTSSGRPLYTYSADPMGQSACSGACLQFWPALLLPSGVTSPVGGPGVQNLGAISVAAGRQVTFGGHPLYTFVNDTKAGQVSGQGVTVGAGKFQVAVVGAAATAGASSATQPTVSPTSAPPAAVKTPAPAATTAPGPTMPPATSSPATSPPATRATVPMTQPPVTSPPPTAPRPTTPPTTAPKPTTTTTAPGGGVSY